MTTKTTEKKFEQAKKQICKAVSLLMDMGEADNIGAADIADYCTYIVDCGGMTGMNPREFVEYRNSPAARKQ
jgi:C4-dicarboxylate transporter